MITPVKANTNYTCALACIESLSIDKNKKISQKELIDKYPIECRKGEKEEGAVTLPTIDKILKDLKLAKEVIRGSGKDFILKCKNSINDGIFIWTTKDRQGVGDLFHLWRLTEIHADIFVVLETDQHVPRDHSEMRWGILGLRQCIVLVCLPHDNKC